MDELSLCLICKDENDYLAEWLDYHIVMGVARFYIYDNESRISLRETLHDYIRRGWVVVVDIHGQGVQLHAYDHCLRTFGQFTRWLGFIDTDEFLVPKTAETLPDLLNNYTAYAGLAVSSLFFGSNGHISRPAAGQMAAYTRRTHPTFQGNVLIKSIVQPGQVLQPTSPHDFAYQENAMCVNEERQLVDGMKSPNHIAQIQLNHYFCRSESEIVLKMARGRGDTGTSWQRSQFSVINQQASYEDKTVLELLARKFTAAGLEGESVVSAPLTAGLPVKLAALANRFTPTSLEMLPPRVADLRAEITTANELKARALAAEAAGSYVEALHLNQLRLQAMPHKLSLQIDLAINYIQLKDAASAWRMLSQVWKQAPNSYPVLNAMAYFFLQVANFEMAEKTCRLLLEMAPHNLLVLGYLAEALLGQNQSEEALKVGRPVVELAALSGELPAGMTAHLVKRLADDRKAHQDYPAAVQLWETLLQVEPLQLDAVIELIQLLRLQGNQASANRWLERARQLAPGSPAVLALGDLP